MPDVLKATTFKVQKNIKLGFVSFFGHIQEAYSGQLFSPRSFVWLTKLITQPTVFLLKIKTSLLTSFCRHARNNSSQERDGSPQNSSCWPRCKYGSTPQGRRHTGGNPPMGAHTQPARPQTMNPTRVISHWVQTIALHPFHHLRPSKAQVGQFPTRTKPAKTRKSNLKDN